MHNRTVSEDVVLSVLGGMPIEAVARRAGTSPARLAEAVERYRAAGQQALHQQPAGWHQVYVQFAVYPTAARAFRAYLFPTLREETVGTWWFLRKYPYWRLRVHPAPDAPAEPVIARVTQALDSAAFWGAVKEWHSSLYEPETIAFGGLEGLNIAHRLFYADSLGVLAYDQLANEGADRLPEAKVASLLLLASFLRSAGLEWGEQGDVWGQVEAKRALPGDVPPAKVSGMVDAMRSLLTVDASAAFADGPLAPLRTWLTSTDCEGQALRRAAHANRLGLGLRGILARHIIFHWNRMGFSTRQQAIWARAAREAVIGA
ncbi:thiopeptide-type bacteriocin biosynthesis protein (plasmid) [Streptomyces longwoodensis]|uniref:thiopeptide-type bacteriocin biosynthesis protein n=1 Tax=Streptomyces longwoodensis TaxID=68231 RepID=UPI002F91894E|nr:thiopeptide-type bacteriocin biosynthesis protein [Streptomyces longwoodensis]